MNSGFQDAIQIRQLHKNEEIPWPLLLLADPSKEMVDDYLRNAEIFIAIHDTNILGAYTLYPITTDLLEIKNIAVDEKYQRMGLGKLLLDHASATAKSKSYKQICIGTANAGIWQIYLYQRQGFDITGLKKNFFIDNYPEPIYENGIQCKHMIVLTKKL